MAAMAEVAERTLAGMGFELVDARASGGGRFLTIFIDRPGGITVDHCAEVSRQLSRVFEVEGIDYDRLEVSSPGLDRPLRREADFARFAGRRAEVRMRTADAGGRRKFAGVILAAADGRVRMAVDGGEVALGLEDLDRAKLIPEL
jgi:ribosome maturation factor RimP